MFYRFHFAIGYGL